MDTATGPRSEPPCRRYRCGLHRAAPDHSALPEASSSRASLRGHYPSIIPTVSRSRHGTVAYALLLSSGMAIWSALTSAAVVAAHVGAGENDYKSNAYVTIFDFDAFNLFALLGSYFKATSPCNAGSRSDHHHCVRSCCVRDRK